MAQKRDLLALRGRAALDRLLDPENSSVTLRTLHRAAAVLGKQIRVELVG